jgi:flagellar biogenesis protein FliO
MTGDTPDPQQWLLAVLGCALLLAGLIFAIRRLGARLPRLAAQRRTKVLERTALAHGVHLMVVEYGERRLLLSVTAAGSTCLRDDPVSAAVAPQADGAGT